MHPDDFRLLPPATASQAGFTLLELVVAITLFAALSVLLGGALRLGTRAVEKTETVLERSGGAEPVQSFLRRQLSAAIPALRPHAREKAPFEGAPDAVSFVAPLPAHLGLGGLHSFRISVEGGGERGSRLMARWWPVDPGRRGEWQPGGEAAAAYERVLVAGIGQAAFAYSGGDAGSAPGGWRSRWHDARLPSLIRLRLRLEDGTAWPDLLIAPRLRTDALR